VFSLITSSVTVMTQVWLLMRTLSGKSASDLVSSRGRRGRKTVDTPAANATDGSSIALLFLAFLPSIVRLVGGWMKTSWSLRRSWAYERFERERNVKDLGRNGGYKQEVVLFGLKDWILQVWDEQRRAGLQNTESFQRDVGGVDIGIGLVQEGVQNVFYVSLAKDSG
jgi:hypothetical protein